MLSNLSGSRLYAVSRRRPVQTILKLLGRVSNSNECSGRTPDECRRAGVNKAFCMTTSRQRRSSTRARDRSSLHKGVGERRRRSDLTYAKTRRDNSSIATQLTILAARQYIRGCTPPPTPPPRTMHAAALPRGNTSPALRITWSATQAIL